MKFTIKQFNERFPDEATCLKEIWQIRYGEGYQCKNCQRVDQYSRVFGRLAYACSCGKQIERELGCTYKTAWHLMRQVRSLMADEKEKLYGHVEIDETFYKAKLWCDSRVPKGRKAFFAAPIVFGAVERFSLCHTTSVPVISTGGLLGYGVQANLVDSTVFVR